MRLLPAEQRTFAYEDDVLVAGMHENKGYRWYTLAAVLDRKLLARSDDLKRVLVDEVDGSALL
jgi:hypothetical protein